MDVKKLGLVSTIAVLSVTVALNGCDLLGRDQEEIKHLNQLIKLKDQNIEEIRHKAMGLIKDQCDQYNDLLRDRNDIVKKYNNRIAKVARGKIALAYAYDNDGNIHEVEQVIPE